MTKIRLVDSGPTGQVPAQQAALDGSQSPDLSWNEQGREIPDSLGGLDGLRQMRLESNRLWGCLPSTRGTLQDSELDGTRLPFCQ